MSTYYRPSVVTNFTPAPCVIPLELIEQKCSKTRYITKEGSHLLHDGTNYLHVALDATGKNIIDLMRYGKNNPEVMFEELFVAFGVMMISEYDFAYPQLAHPHSKVMTIKLKEDGDE